MEADAEVVSAVQVFHELIHACDRVAQKVHIPVHFRVLVVNVEFASAEMILAHGASLLCPLRAVTQHLVVHCDIGVCLSNGLLCSLLLTREPVEFLIDGLAFEIGHCLTFLCESLIALDGVSIGYFVGSVHVYFCIPPMRIYGNAADHAPDGFAGFGGSPPLPTSPPVR